MKPLTLSPPLALTSALMTLACAAAYAQGAVKEIGAPMTPPAAIGTYGMDTPSRAGLKALTPAGWQLMVHKKVVLPATVSWSADQTWLQAVGVAAQKAGAAALIDWTTQTIYLQPAPSQENPPVAAPAAPPVAATPPSAAAPAAAPLAAGSTPTLAPVATLSPLVTPAPARVPAPAPAQAAAPEPAESRPASSASAVPPVSMSSAASGRADPQSRAAQAERDLAAARAAAYWDARAKGERLDPGLEYVEDSKGRVVPVQSAVPPTSTPAIAPAMATAVPPISTTAAVAVPAPAALTTPPASQAPPPPAAALSSAIALNRPDHRQAAEQLAGLHGAYLDYRFVGQVRLPGPVTLIGADLGEDVRLLQQAMGPASPVVLEYCRQPSFVRALPAGQRHSGAEASACQEAVARPRQEAAAPSALSPMAQQPHFAARPLAAAPGGELGADLGRVRPVTSVAAGATAFATLGAPAAAAPAAVAAAPRAPALTLRVEPGQDLEDALRTFLTGQGMRLSWESASAFASTELVWERSGADVVDVLRKLLPALGLEAEVNLNDKTVRVTDRANQVRG